MEETNVLPHDHAIDVKRFVQERMKILLLTLQRHLPHIKDENVVLPGIKYHKKCCQIWAFYAFATCSRHGP